ncbi:hypothetical protein HO173_012977 [Letharia columbiana]|uniref:Ecp2 effector protein domain-containing protein n=1 Tax=Letharia columbiana TaxID=112416 RepID=A0A8H6CK05_9LECA|nr:uncharacterized protein HO173_012977 [Letharia columbiana]KAF6224634.1 hypothetical protein HO173_012977 [Letharia columbiana]
MILYLLLLLLTDILLPAAHAASIPSSSSISNIPSFVNLTSAREVSQSTNRSTIEGDSWEWYCTPIQRWNQPPMEKEDCRGVLDYFYYETMMDGGRGSMEFLSPGAKKTEHAKGQMTPRKYTFGTCTLALIIVRDFPIPDMLPGGYKTGPPTEATTYLNLNRVAASLVESCVIRKGEAGWQPTGQDDGLGVFVWSTDSQEDKEIEDEEERFVLPKLRISSNDSAATS